jgi:subtilisin-like proprotein convertase family protein
MKHITQTVLLALSLSAGLTASAQTTTLTNFPVGTMIPDDDPSGLASAQTVSTPITYLTGVKVTLKVSGTFNGDLYCYLTHGSGHTVLLNRVGRRSSSSLGYGDSGFDVKFDDAATNGDVHVYRLTLNGSNTSPITGALTNVWAPDGRTNSPFAVLNTDPRTAFLSSFNGSDPNGEWVLFIADAEGGDISTLVNWGLELTGYSAPSITMNPANQSAECSSGGVTFNVTASGSAPLSYQWRFNGSPISGATGNTFSTNNVTFANAGNYDVVIANNYGSATSAVATLTVVDTTPPAITCSSNIIIYTTNIAGTAVSFTTTATDTCSGPAAAVCNPASGSVFSIGTTTVNCTAQDASANVAARSFTVTVILNHAPVAANITLGAVENHPRSLLIEKIRAHDSDPDDDLLTVSAVSATSTNGGTITLGSTNVIYLSATNFVGTDMFTYTLSDGRGGFATGSVVVTVTSENDPSLNRIGSLTVTQNGVVLRFAGIPGYTYSVERTSDLATWIAIGNFTVPDNGIAVFTDSNAPAGQGFYRTSSPSP